MTSIQQHMLFLSSDDSAQFYDSSSNSDFTVELGQTYDLQGKWTVELMEFKCLFNDVKPDTLYIHCDICEESFARNSHVPLLRTLVVPKTKTKRIITSFEYPFALKVVKSKLQRLRIYITDDKAQLVSFGKEPLTVTLRLSQHAL